MTLPDFLASVAGRRWEWGKTDCLLMPADWILAARGIDPAAEYRGMYTSARGALKAIKRAGGIEALVCRAMERCGIEQTIERREGDVALVLVPVGGAVQPTTRTAGAICVSEDEFAVMTEKRLAIVRGLSVVAAWRV